MPEISVHDPRNSQDPSSFDYETTDKCDQCGERRVGTMFHARGATGRICEVMFLCKEHSI